MITSIALDRIRSIFGSGGFLDSAEDRIAYSYDGTPLLKRLPDAIVIPQNVDQISRLLKLANEEHFVVVPRGSGSGLSEGPTMPPVAAGGSGKREHELEYRRRQSRGKRLA